MSDLEAVVKETRAEIAVLTVPAAAAVDCYESLIKAGIRAVLKKGS